MKFVCVSALLIQEFRDNGMGGDAEELSEMLGGCVQMIKIVAIGEVTLVIIIARESLIK